jgi:hypothetical protein
VTDPAASRADRLFRFREGERVLREAVAGLDHADLSARPLPNEWSVREIVHHLADGELISATRLRRLLVEDEPLLPGYDAAGYASAMAYADRPLEPAIAAFAAARALSADLLASLSEEQWARPGKHEQYGPYGVETWLEKNGNHVANHCQQIAAVRAALGKPGS